jgi:CheY-like chemotaxis protein
MTIQDLAKLIDSIAKLMSSVAWPFITLVLLIRFWPDIMRIIESREDINLKGLGFEANFNSKTSASVDSLVAARATKPGYKPTSDSPADESKAASEVVADSVTPRFLNKAKRSAILWVDDTPDNNIFERKALEALGIRIILAASTSEALDIISNQRVDTIISDMCRPPDTRAGYTLLEYLRANGIKTPYVIYAGSRSPEHIAESKRYGAIGCTNDPYELFQYVVECLRLSV